MPQKPYKPDTDEGVAILLSTFDTNIAQFASKYHITTDELLRIHKARLAWRWFLDCLEIGRQWAMSITEKKDQMNFGPAGSPQAMPAGPTLPTVPTVPIGGGGNIPVTWEPDFFTFFGSIVSRIKDATDYIKGEGTTLGIEGAEIPPPDPGIIPNLKVENGTGGNPQLDCPKGQFDGIDVHFTVNDGPAQYLGFINLRRWVHVVPPPAPNTSALYKYQAQYRYKGEPFGQKSGWKQVSVAG